MPICNGIYYMNAYTEDNLVQKTTVEYLVNSLGWNESVNAMQEVFGAAGTLGRTDEGEVLLGRYLRPALEWLNPGLPAGVYVDAIRILSDTSVSESLDAINREKYKLILDGIPVRYTAADGTKKKVFLRVFDFANPADNHFLCVRLAGASPPRGRCRIRQRRAACLHGNEECHEGHLHRLSRQLLRLPEGGSPDFPLQRIRDPRQRHRREDRHALRQGDFSQESRPRARRQDGCDLCSRGR